MNTHLFFSQVNCITPRILKVSETSLKNDFSFVTHCFYRTGNNIQAGINEQTASISKKYTTLTR